MNCPFYGVALSRSPQLRHPFFIETGGNRCALITEAHSPCRMEVIDGQPPEWWKCPRNPERNGTGGAALYAVENPGLMNAIRCAVCGRAADSPVRDRCQAHAGEL